jgi:hypothetical protein
MEKSGLTKGNERLRIIVGIERPELPEGNERSEFRPRMRDPAISVGIEGQDFQKEIEMRISKGRKRSRILTGSEISGFEKS